MSFIYFRYNPFSMYPLDSCSDAVGLNNTA